MKTKKDRFSAQPLKYPAPYVYRFIALHTGRLKHLGVSPAIDNGIRYWRVIWRPFLDKPIEYKDRSGRIRVKTKKDSVKTERYPVVGNEDEIAVYRQAITKAREVYKLGNSLPPVEPKVDWDTLAKSLGKTINKTYTRKSLNNGVLDEVEEMFNKGSSNALVAKAFGVDRSTASRWRKKVRSIGAD